MLLKQLSPEDQQFAVRDILALSAEGHTQAAIRRHLRVAYGLAIGDKRMRVIITQAKQPA